MKNFFIKSLLLVCCNVLTIISGPTAETTKETVVTTMPSKTTEAPLVLDNLEEKTTKGPTITSSLKSSPIQGQQPTTVDPLEQRLKDIFVVNFAPKSQTTTGPVLPPDNEFSSVEIKSIEKGHQLTLGTRTNFRTPLNCRCVIHNRCARTNACDRNKRHQKQKEERK